MIKLPNDLLNRLRPLSHALADLVSKHDRLQLNHPERGDLARMIRELEMEVAHRAKRAVMVRTSLEVSVRACAERPFDR
jgi:hypothetical protein